MLEGIAEAVPRRRMQEQGASRAALLLSARGEGAQGIEEEESGSVKLAITITEAAAELCCCTATIHRLIKSGRLVAIGRNTVSRYSVLKYAGVPVSELNQAVCECLTMECGNGGPLSLANDGRQDAAHRSTANGRHVVNAKRKRLANRGTISQDGQQVTPHASTNHDSQARPRHDDAKAREAICRLERYERESA